jgi:hypothetical protein
MQNWVSVKVTDGLFPSEKTVQFKTDNGELSLFVDSAEIKADKLKVAVLDKDDRFSLVQVPSQSGATVAKVPNGEIVTDP